jgi:hypothetical protein
MHASSTSLVTVTGLPSSSGSPSRRYPFFMALRVELHVLEVSSRSTYCSRFVDVVGVGEVCAVAAAAERQLRRRFVEDPLQPQP